MENNKGSSKKLKLFASSFWKNFSFLWLIALLGLLAFATALYSYWDRFHQKGIGLSTNTNTWGVFGDYIGGVMNPILSFFALIALLETIRIQRIELEATREELKQNRQVAKDQLTHFQQIEERESIETYIRLNEQKINDELQKHIVFLGNAQKLKYVVGPDKDHELYSQFSSSEDPNKTNGFDSIFTSLVNIFERLNSPSLPYYLVDLYAYKYHDLYYDLQSIGFEYGKNMLYFYDDLMSKTEWRLKIEKEEHEAFLKKMKDIGFDSGSGVGPIKNKEK
ncbi:MAG: hypothetical protein QNL04_02245 [SAR324 cluster bacterium]|nr:hypothetical protein [SAR324 cluster bacterium]